MTGPSKQEITEANDACAELDRARREELEAGFEAQRKQALADARRVEAEHKDER